MPRLQAPDQQQIDQQAEIAGRGLGIDPEIARELRSVEQPALMMREHNPNIVFTVPDEGGEIWIDYLSVLASSPRKELAMRFIDFLNDPENAARVAQYVHYATPNEAAEKLLPADFRKDTLIYPGEDVLSKSEFYTELPSRIAKKRNNIFARILQ